MPTGLGFNKWQNFFKVCSLHKKARYFAKIYGQSTYILDFFLTIVRQDSLSKIIISASKIR
jgi:hypothetical protein